MGIEKQASRILIAVIVILIALAIVIVVKQKEKFEGIYKYSNGDSEFEVQPVMIGSSLQYDIKLYFPDNPKPYLVTFRYDPLKLENISIDRKAKQLIADDKLVYVTIDPDQKLTGKTTIAALEIDKVIDNYLFYNIPVSSAVTKPYQEMKVKSCKNATAEMTVIWLKTGDSTKVYTEENCIIVQGSDEEELVRAADRLGLLLIGIMK